MKITEEESKRVFLDDNPDFELVEEGPWSNDYKDYCLQESVYKQVSTGKLFMFNFSRCGSHYTDYYYEYPTEVYEVEQIEVLVKQWVVKNE